MSHLPGVHGLAGRAREFLQPRRTSEGARVCGIRGMSCLTGLKSEARRLVMHLMCFVGLSQCPIFSPFRFNLYFRSWRISLWLIQVSGTAELLIPSDFCRAVEHRGGRERRTPAGVWGGAGCAGLVPAWLG